MLEVLGSEYIKLGGSRASDVVVIAMHAFKNALIPVFTLAGVNMVVMVNAAVIIEVIFAWPGIGRCSTRASSSATSRWCRAW